MTWPSPDPYLLSTGHSELLSVFKHARPLLPLSSAHAVHHVTEAGISLVPCICDLLIWLKGN